MNVSPREMVQVPVDEIVLERLRTLGFGGQLLQRLRQRAGRFIIPGIRAVGQALHQVVITTDQRFEQDHCYLRGKLSNRVPNCAAPRASSTLAARA